MALKVIYLSNAEMDSYGFKGLDNVVDRFMLMRKELFNWIREQNKMPTKHKMTRAEAKACFLKHMPRAMDGHAEDMVDFYIEAGMLEIVEEPGIPIGFEFPYHMREEYTKIFNALAKQGFTVIKA